MTARVFVDTCVFLYAHDESEPDKRPRARNWLEHLWREMAGRTSIQVLSEYYLTVSRKLDPGLPADDAWNDAATYFAWRPQPVDEPLISRARLIEQRHAPLRLDFVPAVRRRAGLGAADKRRACDAGLPGFHPDAEARSRSGARQRRRAQARGRRTRRLIRTLTRARGS